MAAAWPSGAVVLLTGASSGLGKELFTQLCRKGAQVHVLVHPRHRGASTWETENGTKAASVTFCDLSDEQDTESAARSIAKTVTGLDSLILCAGTLAYGAIDEMPWKTMQQVMTVNYLGNTILLKELLPGLREQREARIVGIGSGSAVLGLRRSAAYTASKAALQNLFEALRAEYTASSVRVLLVVPGYMDTPLHAKQSAYSLGGAVPPTGKPMEVRRVAEAILRLAKHRQGTVFLGRNPWLAYQLKYWCPPLLQALVRRHGY